MEKSKILIVGFCNFNERMYPHLYDVITLLKKRFDVDYLGLDDRGAALARASSMLGTISNVPYGLYLLGKDVCKKFRLQRMLQKKFAANDYHLVVAIDHTALNLVARFVVNPAKLVFWSFDFIAEDCDWYGYFLIRRVISRNRKYANHINMLIAQDNHRLEIVSRILTCSNVSKVFQLPVALCDDGHARRISTEKNAAKRFDVPKIMQLSGVVARGSLELIKEYQRIGSEMELCFHGFIDSETFSLIEKTSMKPKISLLSSSFMDMREEIANADIGFICYLLNDKNHFYIDRASGQSVEFLRLGIPIIVMGNTRLSRFIEEEGAGVHLSGIGDLNGAIKLICNSYPEYSANARNIYEKYFCLESYFRPFCDALNEVYAKNVDYQQPVNTQ